MLFEGLEAIISLSAHTNSECSGTGPSGLVIHLEFELFSETAGVAPIYLYTEGILEVIEVQLYNDFGTGCSVLSRAFEWEKLATKKSAT